MKVLVVLAGLIALALSEAPYPASGWKPSGALLVLPPRQQSSRFESQPSSHQNQQVPAAYGPPPQPDITNQGEASDNGINNVAPAGPSETGAYYVLLPDGKLQKIQYSAAPLKSQENNNHQAANLHSQNAFTQQRFQAASNFNQFQNGQSQFGKQSSFNQHSFQADKFSQSKENVGFGQASNNVNSFQKFNREQNHQQNSFQAQQNIATAAGTSGAHSTQQDASKSSGTPQEKEQTAAKLVAQFSQAQLKANGPLPDGYVASVQFSEVPPITAPVYVFNPAPLVRVLRMAPY